MANSLPQVSDAFTKIRNWIDQELMLQDEEPNAADHPERQLEAIRNQTFAVIRWPEYQRFMEEDWWPAEVHISEDEDGRSVALVPMKYVTD